MRLDRVVVLVATLLFAGCGPHVVRPDTQSATAAGGKVTARVVRPAGTIGGVVASDSVPSARRRGTTADGREPHIPRVPASSVVRLGDRNRAARYHEVRTGETLWSIAKQEGVSLEALIRANGLTRSSVLQPGQLLYIPEPTVNRAHPARTTAEEPSREER